MTKSNPVQPRENHLEFDEILRRLKSLSNPSAIAGMERFGITPGKTFGVGIPPLRALAKEIGKNHSLAARLWNENIRETRILASMIDDPKQLTEAQMSSWVVGFDYWEICDQCIMNLFEKSPLAWQKAIEWAERPEEFVRRAGFVLMARLAVSDKKAKDEDFAPFWELIEKYADDERNMVKKAVNWALRQMGKRNLALNRQALDLSRKLVQSGSKSGRWIASDALRELQNDYVQRRIRK
ncbi:MAG: DNA alkylation repair protein [Candidatus Neomarinimicrobiota bacterium]